MKEPNEFSGTPDRELRVELGQIAFDLMQLEKRRDQIKAELRYREVAQKAKTFGLTEPATSLMLEIFPELLLPPARSGLTELEVSLVLEKFSRN